jgi:hypothetical protein
MKVKGLEAIFKPLTPSDLKRRRAVSLTLIKSWKHLLQKL